MVSQELFVCWIALDIMMWCRGVNYHLLDHKDLLVDGDVIETVDFKMSTPVHPDAGAQPVEDVMLQRWAGIFTSSETIGLEDKGVKLLDDVFEVDPEWLKGLMD